jgi:predicted aldo/keto reductase-like oxidoreductase
MSGAVDVRKDLNSIASLLEQLRQNNAAIMLDRVSAAVAELIKAAKNVVDAADPKHVGSVEYRLMEALARVGGAS